MAPTTPPECVNEKERGQEESTAEVLTEGNEGLRLHLFWPSTLPAGPPPWFFSLLLASVTGAGGQRLLRRSPHLVFTRGRKTGNAGGSICRGLAAVSAGPPGGGRGGVRPGLRSSGAGVSQWWSAAWDITRHTPAGQTLSALTNDHSTQNGGGGGGGGWFRSAAHRESVSAHLRANCTISHWFPSERSQSYQCSAGPHHQAAPPTEAGRLSCWNSLSQQLYGVIASESCYYGAARQGEKLGGGLISDFKTSLPHFHPC